MPVLEIDQTTFTTRQIAKRYHISEDKVRLWISSGQLRGIDVSSRASRRPRWRVSAADLLAFENRRAAIAPPLQTRRRKPASDEAITPYF